MKLEIWSDFADYRTCSGYSVASSQAWSSDRTHRRPARIGDAVVRVHESMNITASFCRWTLNGVAFHVRYRSPSIRDEVAQSRDVLAILLGAIVGRRLPDHDSRRAGAGRLARSASRTRMGALENLRQLLVRQFTGHHYDRRRRGVDPPAVAMARRRKGPGSRRTLGVADRSRLVAVQRRSGPDHSG